MLEKKLETICSPYIDISPSITKRSLIINSILYEDLLLDHSPGYFFYRNYPKLAEDCLKIGIEIGSESVPDYLDKILDESFNLAIKLKKKPIDIWAAYFTIGGNVFGTLLDPPDEKKPIGK